MTDRPWTPGPWRADYLDHNGQRAVSAEHFEVCTCWHHCVGSIEKEMEANATLIAAAPDMAEALRLFLEYDGTDTDDVRTMLAYADALAAAKAAYAKARGAA